MNRIVNGAILAALLITSTPLLASPGPGQAMAQLSEAEPCRQFTAKYKSPELLAQQGCCSWHGGVWGCENGDVICCDGSQSPSCGCNAEDPVMVLN